LGRDQGSLVMAGHDEGVLAWGPTVDAALAIILKLNEQYGGT
jgi:hypothetical protein